MMDSPHFVSVLPESRFPVSAPITRGAADLLPPPFPPPPIERKKNDRNAEFRP